MVNFIKFIKSRNVQVLMVLHSTSFTKNLTSCIHSRVILLIFFLQSAARIMNNQRCHLWRQWHKWQSNLQETQNHNSKQQRRAHQTSYRRADLPPFSVCWFWHTTPPSLHFRTTQAKGKIKIKAFPNYLVIFSVGQLKLHAFNNTKAVLLYSFNPQFPFGGGISCLFWCFFPHFNHLKYHLKAMHTNNLFSSFP